MKQLLLKAYGKLPWIRKIRRLAESLGSLEAWRAEQQESWRNTGHNFTDIWGRFTRIWERIGGLERSIEQSRIVNIPGRLDVRLFRLEVLLYFADPAHMAMLDESGKDFIHKMWSDYNYEEHRHQIFPPDPFYENAASAPPRLTHEGYTHGPEAGIPSVLRDADGCHIILGGRKLYLPYDRAWGEDYIRVAYSTFEAPDSPHTYLRPQDDGIDVPRGAVLADIGAAEGLFGIKYLDRCRKLYLFECDPLWLERLRKTCAPYKDTIEIVEGLVGDSPNAIRLDDFFKDRKEKPDFIKMDIEGAEGAALRGMPELLAGPSPLTLLVCAYHRQEDWDNYYAMLHERFRITSSNGYYWHMGNAKPPFLRRGVMRAVKKV